MAPALHLSHTVPSSLQASQLGVYRAFVDNYGVAMETAEKCCQANAQFAEISEVLVTLFRQVHPSTSPGWDVGRSLVHHDPREQGTSDQVLTINLRSVSRGFWVISVSPVHGGHRRSSPTRALRPPGPGPNSGALPSAPDTHSLVPSVCSNECP